MIKGLVRLGFALLVCLAIPPASRAENLLPGNNNLVCYYTNWTWYRPDAGKFDPSNIPAGICNVIIYAFTILDGNTLLMVPSDSWADIDNNFFQQVVAHKAYGSKVLIAIGGWNDSASDKYYRLISNPGARAAFIADALAFIDRWGFDGLDLDYEYPGCPQNGCVRPDEKGFFVDFVRELQAAFTPRGLYLSAAVSVNENTLNYGYDIPALGSLLSWVNVMSYDLTGSWDGATGHHGALHNHPWSGNPSLNVEWGINYWISQGAPAHKLHLGIPLYG
jgi:chitinase